MRKHVLPPLPPDEEYIFRPWRTCPQTGQRIYARNFGLRAWPIPVKKER